jgi:serine phosphatase RsbU (regulator of sigma subunit)
VTFRPRGKESSVIFGSRVEAVKPPGDASDLSSLVARYEAEIASLSREILDRYEELSLFYRLAEELATVLGEEAIARTVLSDAARVLGALEAELWLRAEDDTLRLVSRVGARPASVDEKPPKEARDAIEAGRQIVREASPGREALAAVPLPGGAGRSLGAFLLRGRTGARSYRTGELKLLAALASLASAFIRNDRLAEKARLAELRRRELEIARQVHRRLLPRSEPRFRGLDMAAGFRAAEAVGGDYYGYFPRGESSLGVAVADVSGHGVGAALFMAALKGFVQAEASRTDRPAAILERLNEALLSEFMDTDVFTTVVFFCFEGGGRHLRCSNGGHNPPLLLRAGGRVDPLEEGGPALGILPGASYREEVTELAPGDVLIAYTDGVVETRNERGSFYGLDRLREAALGERHRPASDIRDALLRDVDRFRGEAPLRDDLTLLVIRATSEGGSPS